MVAVCQQCGDKGFPELLDYCNGCGLYAIHCYCLDVLPATFAEETVWLCVDCDPEDVKPTSINLCLPAGGSEIKKADIRRAAKICTRKSESPRQELNKKKKKKSRYYKKRSAKTIKNNEDIVVSVAETMLPELDEVQTSGDLGQDDVGKQLSADGARSGKKPRSIETKATPLCTNYAGAETGLGRGSSDEEAESGMIRTALVPVPEPLDIDFGSSVACLNEEGDALKSQPSFIASSNNTPQLEYVHAQPIIEPIWRGSFRVGDGKFGFILGLVAHLSSLAGSKVYEAAKQIPESLCLDLVPKSDVWPKAFEKLGPNDESIALYFFADNHRDEKTFKDLIEKIISQDLALRTVVQEAELLLFSSHVLPFRSWKFQGNLYLWGVFRKKQVSHRSNPNGEVENKKNTPLCDRSSPVSPLSVCYSNVSGC